MDIFLLVEGTKVLEGSYQDWKKGEKISPKILTAFHALYVKFSRIWNFWLEFVLRLAGRKEWGCLQGDNGGRVGEIAGPCEYVSFK